MGLMDKALVRDHLEQARRHVADGDKHVARQRQLVAKLDRDGHDSSEARRLLEQFEELLRLHIQDRDRLIKELSEISN